MGFVKTLDTESMLRIEGQSSAITIRIKGESASILSLVVPENSRRKGIGTSLLGVAEAELYNRGVRKLEAEYLSGLEAVSQMLLHCGYTVGESVPVVAVDMGNFLKAKAVRNAMRSGFAEALYVSAADLLKIQWDEVFQLFRKLSIPIYQYESQCFSPELSGVVYDSRFAMRAFIFCTEIDDILYVDFLGGVSKKEPQYILAAVQGMIRSIEESDGSNRFSRLSMLLADANVSKLLKRAVKGWAKPDIIEQTEHAEKLLNTESLKAAETVSENISMDDPGWILNEEYSHCPMQRNICWKRAYSIKR